MVEKLGQIIHRRRIEQHFTQSELSQGICSQSMLSAIEHNKYTPNAELLIKLCQRLSIELNNLSLASNYDITNNIDYNSQLKEFCNHHKYKQLKAFLLKPKTITSIQTEEQIQAYYYYLGIALYNTGSSHLKVEQTLNLSLKIKGNKSLTRLTLISLALISALDGKIQLFNKLLSDATNHINELPYSENLNIIFYLAALSYYKINDQITAFNWIKKGISFVVKHNSHYMLANYYRLLAEITNNSKQEEIAEQRSFTFSELFGEKVFQDF